MGRRYNTHLQHNDAAERVDQSEAIEEIVGELEDPAILLGDLNAVPTTPEIQNLTGFLQDAWTAAGEGPGYTYPTEIPDRRIDYVMTSPDVAVLDAEVVDTAASDHRPVKADLIIPGTR